MIMRIDPARSAGSLWIVPQNFNEALPLTTPHREPVQAFGFSRPLSSRANWIGLGTLRVAGCKAALICLCVLLAHAVSGALLVYEPFAGDDAFDHGLAGHGDGAGFAGTWEAGPTGGGNIRHIRQGLWDYYPINSRLGEPAGGAAQAAYGYAPHQQHRKLARPVDLGQQTELYLSCILRNFAANPDNECTLALAQGPEGMQLQMGWRYTDRFGAGLTPASQMLYQAWGDSCIEETAARKGNITWYLAAQLISGPEQPTTLRVKAYNSAEEAIQFNPLVLSGMGTNASQWNLVLNLGITNLVFDRIALNMAGANSPSIDELRLGTNWAEVVGARDPGDVQFLRYQGFRADDAESASGLVNPERGYRHELFFGFGRGETIAYGPGGVPLIRTNVLENPLPPGWGSWGHTLFGVRDGQRGYSDAHLVQALRDWQPYGTTVFQGYCYLDPWIHQPLPAELLDRLHASFGALRSSGFKVLLRFAYEKDMSRSAGPTPARILEHIAQLAPVLRTNSDVLYVLQQGFVGAWGEGHSSAVQPSWKERNNILGAVLDSLPPDRKTMVRVTPYKESYLVSNNLPRLSAELSLTTNAAARIGFDNDGFMAGTTDGGTFAHAGAGDKDYDYWTKDSPWVPVDGELFWSDQSWPTGTASVNGWVAALRLRMHHFSTFSLAHSSSLYEGREYSMDAWKTQVVSRVMVESAKMPQSDGYFEDTHGMNATRSAFAYIRDHLGYRLELAAAAFPSFINTSNVLGVELRLYNRGFSTFVNPRPVWLVLLDGQAQVRAEWFTGTDARAWQPWTPGDPQYGVNLHRVTAKVRMPPLLRPGQYRLALWLPDGSDRLQRDSRFAVRCANRDSRWLITPDKRHGLNVLGELAVTNARFASWTESSFSSAELDDSTISGIDADPDGDGASNWEEFVAATSPREAASKPQLTIAPGPGNSVVLRFTAAADRRYQIQSRSPGSLSWDEWPDLRVENAHGAVERNADAGAAPAQLYRLLIEPQ
jgi:hypothetical protein